MGKILNLTANGIYYFMRIISFLLHLWTVYIAFKVGGWVGAIITFITPGFSQLYWSFRAWKIDGFDSPYIQWVIVIVVMWIVAFAFGIFAAFFSSSKNETY